MANKTAKLEENKQIDKNVKKDYIFAVGRRKEAVARVRLYQKDSVSWDGVVVKKGEIFVNKKPAIEYFGQEAEKIYKQPLIVTNSDKRFAITIIVSGGGKSGQLDASVLGISRVLDSFDKEKFHPILKKRDFLSRDARIKERRKVGTGGKARRRKQSPKR